MILRAIGLVKEVYDWISFSEQAFSWLGLAQRAAAVAAGAAVVAAPIVVATKPWQPVPTASAPATVTAPAVPGTPGAPVPLTAAEVDKHIDKITKDNLYSRIFLMQPERRELLKTIVAKCKDTTEIVAAQCEIAVPAWRDVRIAIAEKEHSKKVEEELRRNREKDSKTGFDTSGKTIDYFK